MALEGNLSAFGLSEIFQLIAVQQKTGMLTVSGQSSSAVLFFRDGVVISTRDRRRKARDPFTEYLTRYGILTRDELIKITSCRAAIKAGDKLTVEEMSSLLEQLKKCELPFTCPHGRPTMTRITLGELEKMFRRK